VTAVLWSVTVQATGDRPMTHAEIVELADAVAPARGVASGIGQTAYGAQLLLDATDREEAVALGTAIFSEAAAAAGLPPWPVTSAVALSEDDETDDPDGTEDDWEIE
jgi:hypothetical protein